MLHALLRIWLLASLLFGTLVSTSEASARHATRHDEKQLSQHEGLLHLVAEEPQTLQGPLMRAGGQSHRVVTTRNSRVLPTHGGKPGQHLSRWAHHASSNLLKHTLLLLRRSPLWLRTGAASPRHYYVIALRRLLC